MEDNSYLQLVEEGIKLHFERNGTLDEMRSGLHAKVLRMLHGEKNLRKDEPLCGGELEQRGLSHLLNQLIVDYFEWYGYKHTLETFALETGNKSNKSREKLRRELNGTFTHTELPILLEMVMKHTNIDNNQQKVKDSVPQNQIKVEKASSKFKKVPTKELRKPEWNNSPIIDASNKVDKFLAPRNFSKAPQAKVNIRQRMIDPESRAPKQPKREITKTIYKPKKTKNFDTERSTESPKTSSENNDDDSSSETFADIPNRYYYREQEPAEQSYPCGYGEEGPYEGQHLQKSIKPLPSNKSNNKDKMPKASGKFTLKATNAKVKSLDQSTTKRGKFAYQSNRRIHSSDDDRNMPVCKPRCPDTMISSIEMDSAEDTDENEGSGSYI
ncbi:uncharacterized protein LOC133837847 [Drosophila sulfurigaster albostrigata]|uniref:uncharacterized protein LOC133837847 n=1 Tax=Drosophila sulfurigaster albostrigata TaxID=89887 RepID=UPI002D21A36A|nr:uncharacterized protein LOC133837847 [Drosophila sulfurigaster albostrigata]